MPPLLEHSDHRSLSDYPLLSYGEEMKTGVLLQLRKSEKEIPDQRVRYDADPVVGVRFLCHGEGSYGTGRRETIYTSVVRIVTPNVGNQTVFTTKSGSIYSLIEDLK